MPSIQSSLALGLALAIACAPAFAKDNNKDKDKDQIAEGDVHSMMLAQCAELNAQFRGTPGISDVLKTRPEPAMCECVGKVMTTDATMASMRGATEAEMQKRVENKNFETFFIAKLSSIFFSCLSQELDEGVKNFPLD